MISRDFAILATNKNKSSAAIVARHLHVDSKVPVAFRENQIGLIFISYGDDEDKRKELLSAHRQFHRALTISPWGLDGLEGDVLYFDPLFSEFLEQAHSLKYLRTLYWPYGESPLSWLADEDVAAACLEWIKKPWAGKRRLRGPDCLLKHQVITAIEEGLHNIADPNEFIRRKFQLADRDRDELISRAELVASLVSVGVSAQEAERAFDRESINGGIDAKVFSKGLDRFLAEELLNQETRIHVVPVSSQHAPDFFLSRGFSRHAAMHAAVHFSEPPAQNSEFEIHGTTGLAEWAREQAPHWLPLQIIPGEGLLCGSVGEIEGTKAYISRFRHVDGREALVERTTDFTITRMTWLTSEPCEVISWSEQEITRTLGLSKGVIKSMDIRGHWTGLVTAEDHFITGRSLPHWMILVFRETGVFQIETVENRAPGDIICNCTRTTCARLLEAVRNGANTVKSLADQTGASTLCGSCKPLLEEFVGSSKLSYAELESKEPLGANIFRIRFRPSSGVALPSAAGQSILIQGRIGDRWMTRAYTLTSGGTPSATYEICIKKEEFGEFSSWLAEKAGSETLFRVSEPQGEFLPDRQTKRIYFFAAGIGVTPAVAMMRSFSADQKVDSFFLHWSSRHRGDFVFHQELERLAKANPEWGFEMRATAEEGRLQREDFERICGTPEENTQIFLCGPRSFMESVRDFLVDLGWSKESIRQEAFASQLNDRGQIKRRPAPLLRSTEGIVLIEQESLWAQPTVSIQEEAKAFLRQCYFELGLPDVFESRWADVSKEIASTGSYKQTLDELTTGANLAWRNSNRCLGRKFWKNLALRDMRYLETEEEMFGAILDHIRTATNDGDLRPLITVFKPDGRRVWNSQYFGYAGYLQEDGSVLGDPINQHITKAAIQLGWLPKQRTPFDYLPIIIEIPGSSPKFFDIPRELILEVPISHPQYPWFAELGLKWYGLPAVSDMAFDIGGIQYTAAPFNGFYMETEVGARDFCDKDRYDLLPLIGERLGLDQTSERSLWRDKAVIEMNIAVLSSYVQRGVRMLDHHTLTHSFIEFIDEEHRCGRKVQADRDYMIPPISGSLTETFHTTFDGNRYIKPGFFYQKKPWERMISSSTNASAPKTLRCPFH